MRIILSLLVFLFPLVSFASHRSTTIIIVTNDGVVVGDKPTGIVAHPSTGKLYVALNGDDAVAVVNPSTRTVETTVAVGRDPLDIGISGDGATVLVGLLREDAVAFMATASNSLIGKLAVGRDPYGIVTRGNTAYVANYGSDTISAIDILSRTITRTYPVADKPYGLTLSPDGTTLYVTHFGDDTVGSLNLASGSLTQGTVGKGPAGITISSDGTTLYVANSKDDTISIINSATLSETSFFEVGKGPRHLVLGNSGTRLYYTLFENDSVERVNTANVNQRTIYPSSKSPYDLAIAPDESMIYITSMGDDTIEFLTTNRKPRADAGSNERVESGELVTLDGSESRDPEGLPITYQWQQLAGPMVTLSGTSSSIATFTAPGVADRVELVFQLIVNDGVQNSNPDTVSVKVKP